MQRRLPQRRRSLREAAAAAAATAGGSPGLHCCEVDAALLKRTRLRDRARKERLPGSTVRHGASVPLAQACVRLAQCCSAGGQDDRSAGRRTKQQDHAFFVLFHTRSLCGSFTHSHTLPPPPARPPSPQHAHQRELPRPFVRRRLPSGAPRHGVSHCGARSAGHSVPWKLQLCASGSHDHRNPSQCNNAPSFVVCYAT